MQLISTDLASEDGMNRKITDQEDPLLLTLEESSKLVAHTRDPAETMENIVELISPVTFNVSASNGIPPQDYPDLRYPSRRRGSLRLSSQIGPMTTQSQVTPRERQWIK